MLVDIPLMMVGDPSSALVMLVDILLVMSGESSA